jgi:hypothetical protein
LYLSEVVSPADQLTDTFDESILREKVRIKDGGIRLGDDITTDERALLPGGVCTSFDPLSKDSDIQWRELPSILHLQILQILQIDVATQEELVQQGRAEIEAAIPNGYKSPEQEAAAEAALSKVKDSGDITVMELFLALNQVDMDSEESAEKVELEREEGISWTELKAALSWLNLNTLISLHTADNDEVKMRELFEGREVLDLRGFS